MLLSTLVKTVKRKSHRGSQTVTTDLITTDIVAAANESIRDLVKLVPKRHFHKLATIAVTTGVAGTPAVYSLASDALEPVLFWYNTAGSVTRLKKIESDAEWIDGVYDPNAVVAKPKYYRELGPNSSTYYKQIEIFPISDAYYTVNYEYYKTKGADLTTSDLSSEITILPDYVHDAIEKGALYYFLKGFDDPGAGEAFKDYIMAKEAFEEADESNKDSDLRLRFNTRGSNPPGFTLK